MASAYDYYAKKASAKLAGKFGGSFVLRRHINGGGYDDDGNQITEVTQDIAVRGIIKNDEVWNSGAYLGSKLVAVLDNRNEPKPDDQLIVGSQTYRVASVITVAPAGVVIIYEVELA